MKLNKKIIISIIIIFVIMNLYLCTRSYAGVLVDNVLQYMNATNKGITQANTVTNIISAILAIVQVGAIGYVLIRLTWEGVRYFSATATSKADLKGEMVRTVIAAVGVFGAATLFKIVFKFFNP